VEEKWAAAKAIAAGGRAAGRIAAVAAFARWIAAGLRSGVGSRGQSAAVCDVVCGLAGGCREAGTVYNRLLIVSKDIYIYHILPHHPKRYFLTFRTSPTIRMSEWR
jgi:hypothetical protein